MSFRQHLLSGLVIPAHPLALTPARELDERHQRALTRYYVAAGAGGMAVGVHTTQFEIRQFGLYRPVLELAAETAAAALGDALAAAPAAPNAEGAPDTHDGRGGPPTGTLPLHGGGAATRSTPGGSIPRGAPPAPRPFVKVAGLAGDTQQAIAEAEIARSLGYDCGLLSLAALPDAPDDVLVRHCRRVAEAIPLFGFYLQPAVGGRLLGYRFWRDVAEIPSLVAIKIAPFNRYHTLDVVRAVAAAGRDDVALYTGNDDSIVVDLLTPFPAVHGGRPVDRRVVGGLLGHWAVWTRRAVELLEAVKGARAAGASLGEEWLRRAAAVTDMNGALFDARHNFAGCIPGIHEVLRRQGLVRGVWTLNPRERLSDGQADEIDRVVRSYPELTDDAFVAEHRDAWLA